MKAWELLLSESQERMLIVIEKGKEESVLNIFEKWDLPCSQIGKVTNTGLASVLYEWRVRSSAKCRKPGAWAVVLRKMIGSIKSLLTLKR
jgi:phosphoribosylformylglycinamidine (FGAM) synthase-like enzyme